MVVRRNRRSTCQQISQSIDEKTVQGHEAVGCYSTARLEKYSKLRNIGRISNSLFRKAKIITNEMLSKDPWQKLNDDFFEKVASNEKPKKIVEA